MKCMRLRSSRYRNQVTLVAPNSGSACERESIYILAEGVSYINPYGQSIQWIQLLGYIDDVHMINHGQSRVHISSSECMINVPTRKIRIWNWALRIMSLWTKTGVLELLKAIICHTVDNNRFELWSIDFLEMTVIGIDQFIMFLRMFEKKKV